MAHHKVVLVVAHQGYQPIEYSIPKKTLTQAGFTVITASNKAGTAMAKDGSTTPVDILIDNVNPATYAGIFFIGGPGAMESLDNPISYTLIAQAARLGKPLGAICVSSRILAHAGVLTDRNATGWDGDNLLASVFNQYGVNYLAQPIVIDDHIITAQGPAAAQGFADAIVKILHSELKK
jgi:protease I